MLSLEGYNYFGVLSGTSSIVSPRRDSFRIILWYHAIKHDGWLKISWMYTFRVSWLGETGNRRGETAAGSTGWRALGSNVLYVDVRLPNYFVKHPKIQPQYFVSLYGSSLHWRTRGASIVRSPTLKGFRCYVSYTASAGLATRKVVPSLAEKLGWVLGWSRRELGTGE